MTREYQDSWNSAVNIILASASSRRKQLLNELSIPFTTQTAFYSERGKRENETPQEYVEVLALGKATAVLDKLRSKEAMRHVGTSLATVIIGSDTTVSIGKTVYNKPRDKAEATSMLMELSNKTHTVSTGVAFVTLRGDSHRVFSVETEVSFLPFEESDIDEYVASEIPLDRAGAYGIQDIFGMRYVEKIQGCYNNVVGLPTSKVYQELSSFIKLLDVSRTRD